MNKKITCACGSIICFTSLRPHLKTKKHDKLYILHNFPKLDDMMDEINNLNTDIPEFEYIN